MSTPSVETSQRTITSHPLFTSGNMDLGVNVVSLVEQVRAVLQINKKKHMKEEGEGDNQLVYLFQFVFVSQSQEWTDRKLCCIPQIMFLFILSY